MLVYSGGDYGEVEAELWGWDHNFVNMLMTNELNSFSLRQDDNGDTKSLVRAASWAAECAIPDRCWTDKEARDCLFEGPQPLEGGRSGIGYAGVRFSRYTHLGLVKTTLLLQGEKDFEEGASRFPGRNQRDAID